MSPIKGRYRKKSLQRFSFSFLQISIICYYRRNSNYRIACICVPQHSMSITGTFLVLLCCAQITLWVVYRRTTLSLSNTDCNFDQNRATFLQFEEINVRLVCGIEVNGLSCRDYDRLNSLTTAKYN